MSFIFDGKHGFLSIFLYFFIFLFWIQSDNLSVSMGKLPTLILTDTFALVSKLLVVWFDISMSVDNR